MAAPVKRTHVRDSDATQSPVEAPAAKRQRVGERTEDLATTAAWETNAESLASNSQTASLHQNAVTHANSSPAQPEQTNSLSLGLDSSMQPQMMQQNKTAFVGGNAIVSPRPLNLQTGSGVMLMGAPPKLPCFKKGFFSPVSPSPQLPSLYRKNVPTTPVTPGGASSSGKISPPLSFLSLSREGETLSLSSGGPVSNMGLAALSDGGSAVDFEESGTSALLARKFQEAQHFFGRCFSSQGLQGDTPLARQNRARVFNSEALCVLGDLGLMLFRNEYDFTQHRKVKPHVDFATAIDLFLKSVEQFPACPLSLRQQVRFNLSMAYLCRDDHGDVGRACELLKEAVREGEAAELSLQQRFFMAKIYYEYAAAMQSQNEKEKAVQLYHKGVKLHFSDQVNSQSGKKEPLTDCPYQKNLLAKLVLDLGVLLLGMEGKLKDAVSCFKLLHEFQAEIPNRKLVAELCLHSGISLELRAGSDVDEVIALYQKGLEEGFDDDDLKATLLFRIACLFRDIKKEPALARKEYEKALLFNMNSEDLMTIVYLDLMALLMETKNPQDLQQAITHGETAVRREPKKAFNSCRLNACLADAYLQSGNAKLAAFHYQVAGFADKEDGRKCAMFVLKAAQLYEQAKDIHAAGKNLEGALQFLGEEEPNFRAEIHLKLAQLYLNQAGMGRSLTESYGIVSRQCERGARIQGCTPEVKEKLLSLLGKVFFLKHEVRNASAQDDLSAGKILAEGEPSKKVELLLLVAQTHLQQTQDFSSAITAALEARDLCADNATLKPQHARAQLVTATIYYQKYKKEQNSHALSVAMTEVEKGIALAEGEVANQLKALQALIVSDSQALNAEQTV